MRFRNLSIKNKLLLAAFLTTGFALVSTAVVSIVKESADWRRRAIADVTTLANIMAEDAGSALASGDRQELFQTLSEFVSAPEIGFAAVYDMNGRLIADYSEPSHTAQHLTLPTTQERGDAPTVSRPINFKGKAYGTVYVEADMADFYRDILTDAMFTALTGVGAFAVAMFIFLRLRRKIVDPIIELSEAMQGVKRTKNYSVRVQRHGHDEIGVLADSFNDMLGAVEDRDAELAQQQAGLELTVRQRTAELKDTNALFSKELLEREAAQETLHGHDSLLKAVAHSAADLLGAISFEDALMSVMELIGLALRVSRIQYAPATIGRDGHLRARVSHEWVAPGLSSMLGEPLLQDFDISTQFPKAVTASLIGEPIMLVVDEMPVSFRRVLGKDGIKSLLIMPVMSENRLCSYLVFLDASEAQREWTWAETDTMKTLADLVGVAINRARTLKELADANTIVQNSPTILYRLKGEPALPLTYVSHNITKFGYDPKKLVASEKLWRTLVYADDQPKVRAAMAAIMEKDFSTATLEFRLVVPSGAYRWVENRYTAVRDEAGRLVEIEGIIIDVNERKAAEEKIALLARTDSLTGLANRATFIERLHQSFASSKRAESPFAVLYLDLDRFKDINDTRGHPAGDLLLREVAERLKNAVRKNDVVARLGGDEFAVLQTDIGDPADAGALAGKIRDSLGMPYKIAGSELHITASIGISPFSPDTSEPDAMLAQADLALYRAKEEGRNQYRFHSEDLDRQVSERVALAEELRSAIEHSEIEVYYQPQVELSSGNIVGMEALVRWNHPTRGVLAPADFIAVAERTGTMRALGQRILENACRQMKLWRDQGIGPPVIAVNVSILQLKAGTEFIRDVTGTLAKAGVAPSDLELDVTESMLARMTLSQNDVLDRLQQLGVRIALDNFGTEYSSFDYLRTYRVNHLKVARQFIEKATEDPKQAATIRAIIRVARELGIQVIAQGVETKEQRALLISIGSPTAQGFYFSEPVRAQRATELLTRGAIERPSDQSAAAE
jgi:diguanylate cyclase (GGDEF)-like protein/PAS domain S-box-containing protein